MKKQTIKEIINKKIKRVDNKYNQPLDEYQKGKYSGWIEALLWMKFKKI